MNASPEDPGRLKSQITAAFWTLLAVYCVWICSFATFPTQDGPIHLYYSSVIEHLRAGSPLFTQFFFIRHPLPPYAVHYLLLVLLGKWFGLVWAEKIVVCLAVILFAGGFRYLANVLSSWGWLFSLAALPLALNWTLGMGFHNFALSLGVSLYALGFWFYPHRVRFLICVAVMLFTHPVPLFVTLAVAGADLVFRMVGGVEQGIRRRDWITLGLAGTSAAYIALFVSRAKSQENLHHPLLQAGMLRDFLLARPLMLIAQSPAAILYAALLFALLLVCLAAGIRQLRQRWIASQLVIADLFVLIAVCITVLYPFIPRNMNGSDYFADRLVLYLWTFAICGACAELMFTRNMQRVMAAAGVLTAVGVLLLDEPQMRLASRTLTQIEQADLTGAQGTKGMFVDAPIAPVELRTSFDPFLWSAARYFRRTDTVMLNAPWLDLPILPIGGKEGMFAHQFPARMVNYPDRLAGKLIESSEARDLVSPVVDFIVFTGSSYKDANKPDKLIEQTWPHEWDCRRENWYSVCGTKRHQAIASMK